jgi:hypothetical protein
MCMGGGGAPPLTPRQMSNEQLAQKVNNPMVHPIFGIGLEAKDRQFLAREQQLRDAYNNRASAPQSILGLRRDANKPISPFAPVVERETVRAPASNSFLSPFARAQEVPKYPVGSDEYFREIAARETGHKNNPYARQAAAAPYQEEIDRRKRIEKDIAEMTATREQTIKDNQAAQAEMQRKADAAREQAFLDLQAKQEAAGKETAARMLASQAAGQSLRILGMQGSKKAAPTAQISDPRRQGRRVRASSGGPSLRIGSSSRSSGAGVNLGG